MPVLRIRDPSAREFSIQKRVEQGSVADFKHLLAHMADSDVVGLFKRLGMPERMPLLRSLIQNKPKDTQRQLGSVLDNYDVYMSFVYAARFGKNMVMKSLLSSWTVPNALVNLVMDIVARRGDSQSLKSILNEVDARNFLQTDITAMAFEEGRLENAKVLLEAGIGLDFNEPIVIYYAALHGVDLGSIITRRDVNATEKLQAGLRWALKFKNDHAGKVILGLGAVSHAPEDDFVKKVANAGMWQTALAAMESTGTEGTGDYLEIALQQSRPDIVATLLNQFKLEQSIPMLGMCDNVTLVRDLIERLSLSAEKQSEIYTEALRQQNAEIMELIATNIQTDFTVDNFYAAYVAFYKEHAGLKELILNSVSYDFRPRVLLEILKWSLKRKNEILAHSLLDTYTALDLDDEDRSLLPVAVAYGTPDLMNRFLTAPHAISIDRNEYEICYFVFKNCRSDLQKVLVERMKQTMGIDLDFNIILRRAIREKDVESMLRIATTNALADTLSDDLVRELFSYFAENKNWHQLAIICEHRRFTGLLLDPNLQYQLATIQAVQEPELMALQRLKSFIFAHFPDIGEIQLRTLAVIGALQTTGSYKTPFFSQTLANSDCDLFYDDGRLLQEGMRAGYDALSFIILKQIDEARDELRLLTFAMTSPARKTMVESLLSILEIKEDGAQYLALKLILAMKSENRDKISEILGDVEWQAYLGEIDETLEAFDGAVLIKAANKPHLHVFNPLVHLLREHRRPKVLCHALLSHGKFLPRHVFTTIVDAVVSVPTGHQEDECLQLLPRLTSIGLYDLARKLIVKGITWDQELVMDGDQSVLYTVLPKLLEADKNIEHIWSNAFWYPDTSETELNQFQRQVLIENAMETALLLDDQSTFDQLCNFGVKPSGWILFKALERIHRVGKQIPVNAIHRLLDVTDFENDIGMAWGCLTSSLNLFYLDVSNRIMLEISNMQPTKPHPYYTLIKNAGTDGSFPDNFSISDALDREYRRMWLRLRPVDQKAWFRLAIMDTRFAEEVVLRFLPDGQTCPEDYALSLEFGRIKVAAQLQAGWLSISTVDPIADLLKSALKIAEDHNLKSARWMLTGKLAKLHDKDI